MHEKTFTFWMSIMLLFMIEKFVRPKSLMKMKSSMKLDNNIEDILKTQVHQDKSSSSQVLF